MLSFIPVSCLLAHLYWETVAGETKATPTCTPLEMPPVTYVLLGEQGSHCSPSNQTTPAVRLWCSDCQPAAPGRGRAVLLGEPELGFKFATFCCCHSFLQRQTDTHSAAGSPELSPTRKSPTSDPTSLPYCAVPPPPTPLSCFKLSLPSHVNNNYEEHLTPAGRCPRHFRHPTLGSSDLGEKG